MHNHAQLLEKERRKYLRLDSVFPVQFQLEKLDGSAFLSAWLQGYTRDISSGGLCLEVNNLEPEDAALLKKHQAKLSLEIELPVIKRPVRARASVAWIHDCPGVPNKYIVGVTYEHIDAGQKLKIMRYAWGKKLFIPAVLSIVIFLGIGLVYNTLANLKLIQKNQALVSELMDAQKESDKAKRQLSLLNSEREGIESRMAYFEGRIKELEAEMTKSEAEKAEGKEIEKSQKFAQLNAAIIKLNQERQAAEEELNRVREKESAVSIEVKRLDEKKQALEKVNFERLYSWLKVHQNPRTGLVISFEGDEDIDEWAFIYDQSLVAQAYSFSGDYEAAAKIFDFFKTKAKRMNGLFVNAYYTNDGSPAEYTVHSGPNIWLGIAVAQYTRKSQDRKYLSLAEDIGARMISLQDEDAQGGIKGGPELTWYSTEHNLDAYAFFNMLFQLTSKPEYSRARDKVLDWLVTHTYDRTGTPVKRGKGDSTIATDTYAWSIAAVGPEKLEALGMNPDKIMEFAELNCGVTVDFTRPGGKTVSIKGFDFAASRNIGRGGVVSSEWTAQMIISFKIMADFYAKKGIPDKTNAYAKKASYYLEQLGRMIISSPSPSGQGDNCLPYASEEVADTGHGWMAPKGKSTGSVSGTAYTLFAYNNYNPLELK